MTATHRLDLTREHHRTLQPLLPRIQHLQGQTATAWVRVPRGLMPRARREHVRRQPLQRELHLLRFNKAVLVQQPCDTAVRVRGEGDAG